jgi:hypothetical protein
MSEPSKKTSRPWEHQRYRPAAHRPEAKLPEGEWGCLVLEMVSKREVRRFSALSAEETRGAPPVAPAMRGGLVL